MRPHLLIMLYMPWLICCGDGPTAPVAVRESQISQVPIGPLTIGSWLPFGIAATNLELMTTDLERDLYLNQIEFSLREMVAVADVADIVSTSRYDSLSIEQVTAAFVQRTNLAMPLFYEPRGFSDHDKLENWATCNFPTAFVAGCENDPGYAEQVRTIIRALKEQYIALNGSLVGIQGYLVMNEIGNPAYTPDYYSALAAAIRIIRAEDPERPALVVSGVRELDEHGSSEEFMRAFFQGHDPPNIFQHEHYVFWEDVAVEGAAGRGQRGRRNVQEQLDLLLQGYDLVSRLVVENKGRWHAIIQAQSEDRGAKLGFRAPQPGELRVQVGLALSRGAAGIIYFVHSSGTEAATGWNYSGLIDGLGVGNERYQTVREINRYLQAIGDELAALYFHRVISWSAMAQFVPQNEFFASVDGQQLEFGLFGDGQRATHLLVVNRRTDRAQEVELRVVAEPVFDVATGEQLQVVDSFARKLHRDRKLTLELAPGGFQLLRFE